ITGCTSATRGHCRPSRNHFRDAEYYKSRAGSGPLNRSCGPNDPIQPNRELALQLSLNWFPGATLTDERSNNLARGVFAVRFDRALYAAVKFQVAPPDSRPGHRLGVFVGFESRFSTKGLILQ